MKYHFKLCFSLLFAVLFLTGCKNFLDGKDLQTELEKTIEIAKSPEIFVELSLKNNKSGSITPSGVNKFKKWQPFEIELSIRNGYSFEEEFLVFEKVAGKMIHVKNPADIIKIEKKAVFDAGAGSWHYIYEATILKDLEKPILINPVIKNLNNVTPPNIIEMTVDSRYKDKSIVDYFDINLYVEEESFLDNEITVSFLDQNDEVFIIHGNESVISRHGTLEDIGNGKYHLSANFNLRDEDVLLDDQMNFKIKVTIKNDGGLASSSIYNKTFIKQSYSNTSVGFYNSTSTYVYNYSVLSDDFLDSEDKLKELSKSLKLIIHKIDENGLGLSPDGNPFEIKYGITQDKNNLDNLDLNYSISNYTTYDLKKEENNLTNLLNSYELDDENVYLDFYDIILSFSKEMQDFYEKSEKEAELNNAIFNIPLPDKLDYSKDIFIKIQTECGINGKEYDVFTIPASPKIIEAKKDEENSFIDLSILLENTEVKSVIYVPDPNDEASKKLMKTSNHFKIPDSYIQSDKKYPFYVGSETMYKYMSDTMERFYSLYSMNFVKYCVEENKDSIRKFPSDSKINIISNGKNSHTHTIKMHLDREIFNQFDDVFVQYGDGYNSTVKELFIDKNDMVSFEVDTNEFCNSEGLVRTDFSYSIIGSKNRNTYITDFLISALDERIKDNLPPANPFQYVFDFYTSEIILSNLILDYSGSFFTLKGNLQDRGLGLKTDSDNNVLVTVIYSGIDTKYNEVLELKKPAGKYLNIPVGHLNNGIYKLSIVLKDLEENEAVYSVTVEVNREKATSKCNMEKTGPYSFKINSIIPRTNITYSVDFFDEVTRKWKTIVCEENMTYSASGNYTSKTITTEKSGIVKLFLNKDATIHGAYNFSSYPLSLHFPEEQVNIHDYLQLRNSIHFYSDKPFFIHILQDDIDWGKNAEDWEKYQLSTYGNPDINSNFWNKEYNENYEVINEYLDPNFFPFTGTEINPVYVREDYSDHPYIYNIPWQQLNKKYAVVEVIWADNEKYIIPIVTE